MRSSNNRACSVVVVKPNRSSLVLLALALVGVLLRAVVPAGYMPGSIESGLLFELCAEGLPASFTAELADAGGPHSANRHGGHGGAHHDGHHGEDGPALSDCSFGHLLVYGFVDSGVVAESRVEVPGVFVEDASTDVVASRTVNGHNPRGPPSLV